MCLSCSYAHTPAEGLQIHINSLQRVLCFCLMSLHLCAAILRQGSWQCLTAIQRGLKATGGDITAPCTSKYYIRLIPVGNRPESPFAVLFVSLFLIPFQPHSLWHLILYPPRHKSRSPLSSSPTISVFLSCQPLRRHQQMCSVRPNM